jgi:hypothetical protein
MRRVIIATLLSAFAVGIVAYHADAQRRRRQARTPRVQQAPTSDAIAPALGDVEWGMSNKAVFNNFAKRVRSRYAKRLAKATDAMAEDSIRDRMNNEIQRIRRSYVRFRGQTTGWDVSFLRDEFTHNNGESMLVIRDGNSQNFYFFINGRLWKWYKAFDAEVFAGQDFDAFAAALQNRFGRALERRGRLTERGEEKRWLEWQDRNTRLRAIDENRFYGFYCLVFESKEVLARLDQLRTNRAQPRGRTHELVEAVTSDDGEVGAANQDIVDRITGRIRRRTQAPEGASMGMASMAAGRATTSMASIDDDDPLSGLDF